VADGAQKCCVQSMFDLEKALVGCKGYARQSWKLEGVVHSALYQLAIFNSSREKPVTYNNY
jgi:hypothetical protein